MDERVAVGAVLLIAPLALLAVGRGGEYTALAAFSPLFFPRAVLWCWVAVAALSLGVDVRAARRARVEARASIDPPDAGVVTARAAGTGMDRATALRIVAVVAAMAAYVACVTELGFLLSSIGFSLATLVALGIRSPVLTLGYGIAMPAAVFTLFNHALGLPLPTSPFSYLF